MTRKYWMPWAALVSFAAICAVLFWPKGERPRAKGAAARAPAAEEAPSPSPEVDPSPRELNRQDVARAVPAGADAAPTAVAPAASVPAEAQVDDAVPEQTDVEKAQLARMPVIYAIRGDYPNDQARFEAMREALHKSGPSTESWTGSARSIFDRWGSALEGIERKTDGGSLRCYVAGCEMLVTFPDRAAFEQGSAKFRGIQDEIPMGRVQTPGVPLPDGRVQVSWMLMRPDTAPPDAG